MPHISRKNMLERPAIKFGQLAPRRHADGGSASFRSTSAVRMSLSRRLPVVAGKLAGMPTSSLRVFARTYRAYADASGQG